MYLSDHELKDAVQLKHLIIVPPPVEYDTTSIDLHLDKTESARVWDHEAFEKQEKESGHKIPALRMGFDSKAFGEKFTKPVPGDRDLNVFRDGNVVYLRPYGFFLWQTQEIVGTPEENPRYICFVDGKSTKARTGLVVHMTAPTVHAGWYGQVTLEISNLGPFLLALEPGDEIAQVIVSRLSSPPRGRKKAKGVNIGQQAVSGR
jgi:dCTP deaminase